jgi:hypothetical protein
MNAAMNLQVLAPLSEWLSVLDRCPYCAKQCHITLYTT